MLATKATLPMGESVTTRAVRARWLVTELDDSCAASASIM